MSVHLPRRVHGVQRRDLNSQAFDIRSVHPDVTINPAGNVRAEYDVAMLRKINQSVQEQGKQALQLIESATASAPNANVGTLLNIRA